MSITEGSTCAGVKQEERTSAKTEIDIFPIYDTPARLYSDTAHRTYWVNSSHTTGVWPQLCHLLPRTCYLINCYVIRIIFVTLVD